MDGRQALTPGTALKLGTGSGAVQYTISRELGRGSSCIVYDASYSDNLGNRKLVRIKECYPHALPVFRKEDGSLAAEQQEREAFEAAKKRMIAAYQKNHELFSQNELTNAVANTSNIYETNGTIYIVSVYLNGCTFADYHGRTLHDCVSLILSVAGILRHIHEAGYLYLDLKPENILTIEGTHELVQLFDFDSMISMEELSKAVLLNDPASLRTSYTKGYAPLEQQTGRLKQLGRHTDLYSLGAVLFFALWERVPTAFDCEPDALYDYTTICYPYQNHQDRLFRALSDFFHHTLNSYYGDRYQNADEAMARLSDILEMADETRPWLRSTSLQRTPAFYGRENEMAALAHFLHEHPKQVINLYGMGGMGKSTLVRQYLSECKEDWDAFAWLFDREKLLEAIADDSCVQINTVTKAKDESTDEYGRRKLQALGLLSRNQKILVVIDNFQPAHLNQLPAISQFGLTILLISRERLPEGLYPAFHLEEMEEKALSRMFTYYSHCDLDNRANRKCFQTIITTIARHTLLTELIARQVANSYLDLEVAETMVSGIGLSDLPDDRIDYVRDQSTCHDTLLKILDRIVEIDRFTEQDRCCLKMLSLFDMPGVEANLFRWMASLPSLDFLQTLERAGWLKRDQSRLYLHPMMQEYIRSWSWNESMIRSAESMMQKLYDRIRPAGKRHDGSKQFPAHYEPLSHLLKAADQLLQHIGWVSDASQRLLFRYLMDAPVDQDVTILSRMLELLKNPQYLDEDSILRLYENAAYFRARLYDSEEAIRILGEMKAYLRKHPSAYYLSAYHRAMAVILHNEDEYGNLKKCLHHEDKAIAEVRLSSHPDAQKQLASCLLDKATTLLSADRNREQARRLIQEAKPLIRQYAAPTDYETYQYECIAAMCSAMDGECDQAENHLKAADDIAVSSADSDLSVAEHLIEQAAPIRMAMEMYEEAANAVLQAIDLCDRHQEAIRYRETRFDAYLFLGNLYALDHEYLRAEATFRKAEEYVSDSPYVWELPLCPEEIRRYAEKERALKTKTLEKE